MRIEYFPRGLRISPELMLRTVRQLAKDNAELSEEVKQLRAAVEVYRELAKMKCQVSLSRLRVVRNNLAIVPEASSRKRCLERK